MMRRVSFEVSSSMLVLASLFSMPQQAFAQNVDKSAQKGPGAEAADSGKSASGSVSPPADSAAIVVTGSRTVTDGSKAPTPVTVVGSAFIQKRGAVNIADVLNELPAFRGTQSGATTAARTQLAGANFADLRGLGTNRTLTLVDGHRFVPAATTGQVDLNLIPSILIERADVVTGGASATYGSDAVAGVVNLILKRRFKGLEGDVQAGMSSHGDSKEFRAALHGGTNFADGRGYVALTGEFFRNLGAKDAYSRDWGRKEWGVIPNPGFPGNGFPQQLIVEHVHNSAAVPGGLITAGPLRGTVFRDNGSPDAFQYGDFVSARLMAGGEGYGATLASGIPLAPAIDRRIAYLQTGYDVADALKLTLDYTYGWTRARGAASVPFDYGTLTIRSDNAFLPAATRAAMLADGLTSFSFGRLSTDIGTGKTDIRNKTNRVVIGARGDLGSSWSYDAYYQYGRNDYSSIVSNSSNMVLFRQAIDAVVDPITGRIVCRSTLTNPLDGCQPFNPFGSGNASPAAYAWVVGTQSLIQRTQQHAAAASVSGNLFELPAGPIKVAMGGEYRSEKGRATGDPISAQNQYYYGNPKSFAGSYHVKEAFGEANIPLLRDAPFARELEVNLAGRWTDYSISGSVGTWKIGGVWQPLSALRFRVTRSRDIRAPNLSDLFTAARTQPTSVFDPVTKTTGFVPVLTAGNTALQPEKADTFTAGVVVQPPFLRTFRLSADYYDISVDGAITALTAQSIVNRCAAGETNLCDQITRNAAGNLTAINNALININTLNVRGIDIEASYSLPLRQLFGGDPGTLTFRGFATHTLRFDQSDGASVTHLAGMSGDQGVPSWLATLNLDYTVGAFSALVQTRFISSGKYNNAFTSTSINNNHTPAAAYVNLSMNYDLGHGSRQDVRIFGVINNLLDKDPVIAPPSQIGVTNLAYYDVIGRTFRAGLQFRF